MKKNLIVASVLSMFSLSALAYEDTLLCWNEGTQQTDKNAIVILGTGAEFQDVDTLVLDGINLDSRDWTREDLYANSKRTGDCQEKWYGGLQDYTCQERVTLSGLYDGGFLTMTLNLSAVKKYNGGVLLRGELNATVTEDNDGAVWDQMKTTVVCKHRAE